MRAALIVVAPLLLSSAPGSTQDTDMQMAQSLKYGALPTDPDSVRFISKFAKCAGRSVKTYARDVLKRAPASERSDKDLFLVATQSNSCVAREDQLKYSPRYLRGPLVEYMLVSDFGLPGWKPKGRVASVYPAPNESELGKISLQQKAEIGMVEVGSCVARKDPSAVAALFASAAASSEETAAFSALSGGIADCLPPGIPVKVSKFLMRGYLAEGAYRTASAAISQQD